MRILRSILFLEIELDLIHGQPFRRQMTSLVKNVANGWTDGLDDNMETAENENSA